MNSTKTATKPSRTLKENHEVRYEWQHLCFFLAECICGRSMWATSQSELNKKWKEHTDDL